MAGNGFIGGELVDHKTHNQWLIKKRQEEKKTRDSAPKELEIKEEV